MESKNVKVIDEHGIDREASVICKIDVDGSDYVLYSIERDGENDNLFVSKLIKNNDGTCNMLNIEDNLEKNKLADVVKELIKFSIDTGDEKTNGVVTLPDGKTVNISSVLFNKEQNINVGKTYVSTVKKSVTKVGEKFFTVSSEAAQPQVEAVPNVESVDMPTMEAPVVPEAAPTAQEVMDSFVNPETTPEPVAPELPSLEDTQIVAPAAPTVEEVKPVEPVVEEKPVEVAPVVEEAPATEPLPVTPVVSEPVEASAAPSEPVVPDVPVVPPVAAPLNAEPAPTVPETPSLVLDGSKETNLNVALGEASSEGNIPVENVEPIREFGQDEPAIPVAEPAPKGTTTPSNLGFANNKFFIVIAVVFFLAACVFLGYEVWQYFKLVG